jgi:hypothetical protein
MNEETQRRCTRCLGLLKPNETRALCDICRARRVENEETDDLQTLDGDRPDMDDQHLSQK